MIEISKQIPFKSGGSGTLINNSPLEEFSPIRFVQPSLVGHNYSSFTDRYCVMVETNIGPPGSSKKGRRPVAWKNVPEMKSILDSCCIVMTKDKWLNLPPKHFHDIYVDMSSEQYDAYEDLRKNYYADVLGEHLHIDNPLVMLAKLYQISQGFVYIGGEKEKSLVEDLLAEETKPTKKAVTPRQTLFFSEQPKIGALEELLTKTLAGKKAIIWFNLSAEFTLIKELLDKLGHRYLSIQGGDKKIGEKVRTFNTTPNIPWLVCQAKSVNYGITVLGSKVVDLDDEYIDIFPNLDPSVHTEVFLSMNFSLEVYSQQQDRIHRLGQEHPCDYYRIFCINPVESRIRQAIAEKINIRNNMLVDIAGSIITEAPPPRLNLSTN